MRNLAFKRLTKIVFITSFFSIGIHAQSGKTTLSQDEKFSELLEEKAKINANLSINNSYKIQIFYGNSSDAKNQLAAFKRDFSGIEGTIIYTNPTYKVYVGNYKSRLHAEKALIEIKKKYPTALLIKPGK
ncbi:SPOR domain-containing protein [Flavobacterium sp. NRK F10]|uniref:SPOR domain-containing protein n=1 Tax=Flavobacterium sp. NRK F10 TaxID=2954931 RepID=UPI00208FFEF8|nr:SPOR domain-containing protein [Flavobacterium sp. NRK F10]MCO6175136.1 SPOR domain-containing protein [Flavobacterium sp. NRK F10]